MQFNFYNPELLIPILRDRGIGPWSYRVCQGCVFTNIPAEDCFHEVDSFQSPTIQSDTFCPHCDTIEESGEKFYLYTDKDLNQKIKELEEIARMAFEE